MLRWVGRGARRMAWPLVFTAVLALVVALSVYPTRTYFEKKQQVAAAETRLADLTADNDKAQAHVDALRTPEEVERIAREKYGMVKKGEEAYRVLPPPQDPVEIPDVWPFNRLHKHLG